MSNVAVLIAVVICCTFLILLSNIVTEKKMSAEFDALKLVIADAKAALTALEDKVSSAIQDPTPADITAVTTDLKTAVDQANAVLAAHP